MVFFPLPYIVVYKVVGENLRHQNIARRAEMALGHCKCRVTASYIVQVWNHLALALILTGLLAWKAASRVEPVAALRL